MLEELGTYKAHPAYACQKCGAEVVGHHYGTKSNVTHWMRKEGLCFDCAFWVNRLSENDGKSYVIGGKLYRVEEGTQDINLLIPRNAQTAYVRTKDGRVFFAEKTQYVGNVPELFREHFPDTAYFITKKVYKMLTSREDFVCSAVGCWDRYRCVWYNKAIEEERGAWNVVPKTHRAGDEGCPMFVDTELDFLQEIPAVKSIEQ